MICLKGCSHKIRVLEAKSDLFEHLSNEMYEKYKGAKQLSLDRGLKLVEREKEITSLIEERDDLQHKYQEELTNFANYTCRWKEEKLKLMEDIRKLSMNPNCCIEIPLTSLSPDIPDSQSYLPSEPIAAEESLRASRTYKKRKNRMKRREV